ncbi:unnamed protein product [Caenorhabditis bovis]|uniref:LEM domain-containing protein n=1 Tax=Caenorhabditis bovis TaxID=2654633 RepID=A0A8S1EXP7_9PELO|nr:unnamed protein product [Caenorhabditis bovis]
MSYPLVVETYAINGRNYRRTPYRAAVKNAPLEFQDTPDIYDFEDEPSVGCFAPKNFPIPETANKDIETKAKPEAAENSTPMDTEDPRIKVINGRKWTASVTIPQAFMGKFMGHNRRTLKALEDSTQCRLKTPRRDENKPIEISSIVGIDAVQRCLDRIDIFMSDAKKQARATHFCALPCNDAEIISSFEIFREAVMSGEQFDNSCKKPKLFMPPSRLHLTLCVLRIFDDEDEATIKNALEEIGKDLKEKLNGKSLIADIVGIDMMNDDPANVNVIFAKVQGEEIQNAANSIRDKFVELGFSDYDYGGEDADVKLHMTLMNARYVSQDENLKAGYSFDATNLLEEFKDFYFGTIPINEVCICPLNTTVSATAKMVDVEKMSDAELRAELVSRGVNAGPVTGTTRALFEKKLKKLLAGGPVKKAATSVKAPPTPKKTPVAPKKAATPPRKVAAASHNTTRTSRRSVAASKSEEEESDEYEIEVDEEIISPKPNRTLPPKRPVSSTPNKLLEKDTSSILNESSFSSSRITSRLGTLEDPVHIPNLITSFDFSSKSIDRPGATPPRVKPTRPSVIPKSTPTTRTSITSSSYISSPRDTVSKNYTYGHTFKSGALGDLGATTAEEDEDSDDGVETSRYVYSSETKGTRNEKGGLIGKAWNKVLGYDFKTASEPGKSYDFRTGSTRTRVVRDKKGKLVVKQSNVFSDSLYIAFYTLLILAVVLSIGYYLTTSNKTEVLGSISLLTKTIRDTINFFYRYAIVPVICILGIGMLGAGIYFGHKKYRDAKEKEESELYDLIERIIELIRESTVDGEPYVSQPHVRDVIFPPAKRRGAELTRWERAVAFIDANESRVTTEIRVLPSGSECAVWRWIGHTQTKRNW